MVRLLAVALIAMIPLAAVVIDARMLAGCFEDVPPEVMTQTRMVRAITWIATSSAILWLAWRLVRRQAWLTRWAIVILFILWRYAVLTVDMVTPPLCFESFTWVAMPPGWLNWVWMATIVLYPVCVVIALWAAFQVPRRVDPPNAGG